MLMMVIYLTEALLVASKKSGLYVNVGKNRAWSCLEIRIKKEFKWYRLIENVKGLKFWDESKISELYSGT